MKEHKHAILTIVIFLFLAFIIKIEFFYPLMFGVDVRFFATAAMAYIIYLLFKKNPNEDNTPTVKQYKEPFDWIEEKNGND